MDQKTDTRFDFHKIFSRDIIFIFVGVCLILLRALFVDTLPDPELSKYVGEKISFSGQIVKEPDVRDTSVRYVIDLDESDSNLLLVFQRFPEFSYGDKIQFSGKLQLPENFVGDSGVEFDYVSYLSKDNIYFLMYRPEIILESRGGNSLFKFLYKVKNYFAGNVSRVVPEPNASFISGLIFGSRNSLGEELLTQLKHTGLIHIVAISGFNVTIIAASILYVTAYLRKRNLGLFLSALFIILFAMMVGLGSTVVRASIMAVVAIVAKYLGRPNFALRTLFVAGFFMALWNPLLVTRDPSFQLSFMATFGLILCSPIVSKYIPFVTEKFGLREIISSTFGVQIFLLPMLIKMSGMFSLVAFLINLVVLPFIPITMLFGFLTGFIGIFGDTVSFPFALLSYLLTEFIITIVEFCSRMPFAYVTLGNVSSWVVIIFYIVYGIIIFKFRDTKKLETVI